MRPRRMARRLHTLKQMIRSLLRRSAILPPPSVLAIGSVWTDSMRPWSFRHSSQVAVAATHLRH